ncbi:uncharacterized protein LOC132755858 [Ruditapes philippinarum]|uniref:uncharacterized protein LOC132755858 n=1 Tax=Ruditapes philippinarum TaxID=129788 RepID=UPI00295B109E|nr:uncharacterized protein LOC132755858 [Ruditapes philippinarum]
MAGPIFNCKLATALPQLKNGETILFEADVNDGALYDNKTGTFVARLAGWYHFSFAVATSDSYTPAAVSLQKDSIPIAHAITDVPTKTSPLAVSQGSNQAIVFMKPGEKAKVVGYHHNASNIVADGFTTFTGYLLKEA